MFEDNKEEDRDTAVPKLMVALAELLGSLSGESLHSGFS
jgi:hypothetical protein